VLDKTRVDVGIDVLCVEELGVELDVPRVELAEVVGTPLLELKIPVV
jgi:hypothetical protein